MTLGGRRLKQFTALAALGLSSFLMTGCSLDEAMRFGWPKGVTPEAQDMRHLWTWSVVAALLMGIIVWSLTFWTITFHRRKGRGPLTADEEFPRQTAYNVPLELTYTVIPLIIVAVLFYFTIIVQNKVEAKQADPAVVVDITAFQWNWKFGYRQVTMDNGEKYNGFERNGSPFEFQREREKREGKEVPLPAGGRDDDIRNYLKFDKIETQGSSDEIPVLVLPTGKRIEFEQAAADVIHSFWVPEFLFKRDVFPFPKQNHQDNRWQVSSIDRTGAFVGRCAEMCGTYHSMMNFEVRAVTPQKFEAYIRMRAKDPSLTNAEALKKICEQPVSVTTHPYDTRRSTSGKSTPQKNGDTQNTSIPGCTVQGVQQ
ncbi:cytochrome c oxidase subunit II [Williamsia sp. CHRR-6]|uniref:aa3-type cytochrome oxidase subunit II n=1 Tax=Williamsia sp. CHRR-6 TaxID=2835871 RepID=UPI001BDAC1BF|nr:cytochrome c oxidase subunit II [Williamsia sp. CHRR-6]MBT0565307.1 cytochrome c oxidase subunit II [Williamsia sp. CHRR-6]